VGDKLRWTRNNRKANIRNGQTVVVTQIELDGSAMVVDAEGRTRAIQLSGKQYLDYAWVSTTYSSQGKTANRVLALLGNTTHREAFYVTISRAKHELTLYTAGREELMRLAQVSKAKENVSDYVPLFEQVTNYDQPRQHPQPFARIDARALGGHIGDRIAAQLATAAGRDSGEYSASAASGARRAGFERGFGDLTAALEQQLEPLSGAVAEYHDQRELLGLTGNFGEAATAINRGLKQLEQSTQDHTRLLAAVERLSKKAESKAGQEQLRLKGAETRSNSLKERALTFWEKYSENSPPKSLDLHVVQRALADSLSPKDATLMLIAGSEVLKQVYEAQGKQKAMAYALHVVQSAVAGMGRRQLGKVQSLEMEIGD
jgi:hypothetical protein